MIKILLLIPALNAGGAERVMVTLANEWSKKCEVTLLVFNDGKCFYELSDKVHLKTMNLMPRKSGIRRLLMLPLIEIKRYRRIYKEIDEGKFDFVLSFCNMSNILVSIVAGKLKNEKIFVSERNDPSKYSAIIRSIISFCYRKCAGVVCQNNMTREYYKKKGFKNKLILLYNPVCFNDIPNSRPIVRNKEIVTVGRLIEQKNQALLVQAFSDIRLKHPEYKLKIYGVGKLQGQLQTQINELGLTDSVFLMGQKSKVMYEVNKSEVFVLPSSFEGFPNVLIEAMATGLPVISSDFKTGIARHLIDDGKNGYLFEVGDLEGLKNKLEQLLAREDEFITMGEKNRKIASKFRDAEMAEQWLNKLCGE